jgi:apolipoprotein N-acyltransferase
MAEANDKDEPAFPPPLKRTEDPPEAQGEAPKAEEEAPAPEPKPEDEEPKPEAEDEVGAAAPAVPTADTKAPSEAPVAAAAPLIRGRFAELAALASGVLYFISFAGIDVWPLTFVCLVPLYLALLGQTPKRATWLGLLTGLAMNVGGFYWLVNMLKTFSGFPTPLCLLFTVIISAYQGGRLGLMGWLHGRAAARGWPVPIVFAMAFAASELIYPLLFPWYYAATIHQVPVLMQLADIGGPILVGLVLVAVNLAIAEPVRAWLVARRGGRSTVSSPSSEERVSLAIDRRVVGAGVLALIFALLYGVIRTKMTDSRVAQAEEVRVGYVQGNMSLMGKRENPSEGLRRHRMLTSELKAKGADLVVWSETSATFPAPEELATKGHFFRDKFASTLGVPTIFGAVLYRADKDRERWFNTAIATDVKGEIRGRYDKQYLLAFGEYLPFGDWFPILYKWSPHSGRFSAGTSLEPVTVETKGTEHKVSILICYEDILPGFTNREVSYANPELLVNMTNDAWFGDTTEPWQHLALAKFRAVEHRRFLVRSTNSGVSALIDPNGRIVDGTLSSTFKVETHDGIARWLRGTTVYELIGDGLWYLVTLGIVIAAFRRRTAPANGPSVS